jgi:hypothetical protein
MIICIDWGFGNVTWFNNSFFIGMGGRFNMDKLDRVWLRSYGIDILNQYYIDEGIDQKRQFMN